MIFLKDVGPHRFAIFCAHSNWHGKKRVVVNALSAPASRRQETRGTSTANCRLPQGHEGQEGNEVFDHKGDLPTCQ